MNKLYRDTVTLYHADAAAQTVVRTVLRGVCWQQVLSNFIQKMPFPFFLG